MVELSLCRTCSSPLVEGWSFCASCGAPVSDSSTSAPVAAAPEPEPVAAPQPPAPPEPAPVAAPPEPTSPQPAALPEPAPVAAPPGPTSPQPAAPPEPTSTPEPEPVAATEFEEASPARTPGGYVPPSAGSDPPPWALQPSRRSPGGDEPGPGLSVSVGATPASLRPAPPATDHVDTAEPVEAASDAPLAAPAVHPEPGDIPAPAVPTPPSPPSLASAPASAPAAKPTGKESTAELVAFGLVAAGALIGVASLFLPWANGGGIGIGNYATANAAPPANQWGWGMPAGIPLLLLSGIALGALAGKDRLLERLPRLAGVLGRVTDVVLPMILGGLYLGVFLLYLTLPSGYGSGLDALFIGACLAIAGAVVSLFASPDALEKHN